MSRETCRVKTEHRERRRRSSPVVRALLAVGMPCLTQPSSDLCCERPGGRSTRVCSIVGGTSSHAFASADPSGRSDGGELLNVCSLVEAGGREDKASFPLWLSSHPAATWPWPPAVPSPGALWGFLLVLAGCYVRVAPCNFIPLQQAWLKALC